MTIPDKTFTARQLYLFNGDDNDRMYVAYKGIVYDVTDCPKWRRGIHEGLHFPGQELSFELDNGAPHAGGVFSHPCVTVIGRFVNDEEEHRQ